ncbi:MAG: ATP-binding protein [Armatimonadetes bacterium]|nr:ATP-binding protein [Armatimonadota bacterium]
MARSDLLLSLVRAGSKGDRVLFRRSLEAIVAEEREKNHNILADRLAEYLNASVAAETPTATPNGNGGSETYLYERSPALSLQDLILPTAVVDAVRLVVEEQERRDVLRSHGLEPRHRMLLVGPPGNGKTSLAEAIAYELMVPLFIVRYEAIIGSYLGETSQRLRRAFDFARGNRCVLFFDEFDAIAKERGDTHETGEIKRVVSSLLMQIDDLPSHVFVVTASNHPELLDRAVWRRFQLRLELPPPTLKQTRDWFGNLAHQLDADITPLLPALERQFKGASYSDLELFSEDVLRALVLAGAEADIQSAISQVLAARKAQFALGGNARRASRAEE